MLADGSFCSCFSRTPQDACVPSPSKTVIAPWVPHDAALDRDLVPKSWIRLPICPAD